jgi:hypothetical protein
MKKIAMLAVLGLFGATIWTTGCGGGQPNCDSDITSLQACCDKATTTKAACDAAVSAYKASKTIYSAAGTGDCPAVTADCTLYK